MLVLSFNAWFSTTWLSINFIHFSCSSLWCSYLLFTSSLRIFTEALRLLLYFWSLTISDYKAVRAASEFYLISSCTIFNYSISFSYALLFLSSLSFISLFNISINYWSSSFSY
jgi:hypothetical protein